MRVSRRIFLLLGSFSCEIGYAWLVDFTNISLCNVMSEFLSLSISRGARSSSHKERDFTDLQLDIRHSLFLALRIICGDKKKYSKSYNNKSLKYIPFFETYKILDVEIMHKL